jgi:formylglycine-generating enzyme required for sulfatase activity
VPEPPDTADPCAGVPDRCPQQGAIGCDGTAALACLPAAGGCLVWVTSGECEDGDPCTTDECVEGEGCTRDDAPDGTPCDDQNPCTETDTCRAGACEGEGTPIACRCAGHGEDWCEEEHGDGDPCNGLLTCDQTLPEPACVLGPAVTCLPDEPCRTFVCDPATGGCAPEEAPDGERCVDPDLPCGSGLCEAGVCTAPVDDATCDGVDDDCDGLTDDECPTDPCVGVPGRCSTAGAVRCEGGAARTCSDTGGGCLAWSAPEDCADADPCTTDECVAGVGCRHTPAVGDATCDGADDDCDGETDEDCPTGAYRLRAGAVVGAGGVLAGSGGQAAVRVGAALQGEASDGTYTLVAPGGSGPETGRLRTAAGPANGTLTFTLRLYVDGAATTWTETHADVPVADGRFTLALGSRTPLDAGRLRAGVATVSVSVGAGPELTPRLALRPVPYALRADDAAALGGEPAAAFASAADLADLVEDERIADYARVGDLVTPFCTSGSYTALIANVPTGLVLRDGATFLQNPIAQQGTWASLVDEPELDVLYVRTAQLDDVADVAQGNRWDQVDGAPDWSEWLTWARLEAEGRRTFAQRAGGGQWAQLEGRPDAIGALWCATRCAPRADGDCHTHTCDGATETCLPAAPLPDGTACGGGEGRCVAGDCRGAVCGGVSCPYLPGYDVVCNPQDHCEYGPVAVPAGEAWRVRDVWIWVPPGAAALGAPADEAGSADAERPVHTVRFVEGFFLAKYEITTAEYEACVGATGRCTAPSTTDDNAAGWGANGSGQGRGDHPQNGLTWQQARDLCAWRAPGGRLPTEAEWEYAASGREHRVWPWGAAAPTCVEAVFDPGGTAGRPWGCADCPDYSCSGTRRVDDPDDPGAASAVGAAHMAGNVAEWVQDAWHATYASAPQDGSAWGSASGGTGLLRGGDFTAFEGGLRSAARVQAGAGVRKATIGARCVRPRN